MNNSWLLPPLFLLLAASIGAQERSHPDTQKVIFENELVRVWDVHVAPGVSEPIHSHERGVTIVLTDYENETISVPEGKMNTGSNKFGDVKWAEPVKHSSRNVGTTEQRVIRIEMKKAAPAPSTAVDLLDALVTCKNTQKLLFENAYVRAIEDRAPSGEVTPKHSHPRGLLINLSDYDSETTTWPDGKIVAGWGKKGDVRWTEPAIHVVKNGRGEETYAIRIDVK